MFRRIWQWLFHKRGPTYFDFSVEDGEVTLLVMRGKLVRTYKTRDAVAVMIAEHALAEQPEQPEQWGVSPLMEPLNNFNVYGDLTPTNWADLEKRVTPPAKPVVWGFGNPDKASWVKDVLDRQRKAETEFQREWLNLPTYDEAKQDYEDLYGKDNVLPLPIKPAPWQREVIEKEIKYGPIDRYPKIFDPNS